VTPFQRGDISGGDLMVNLGGIQHYQKFGYKGKGSEATVFKREEDTGSCRVTVRREPLDVLLGLMLE
jgi:hypothetical protein